MDSDSLIPHLDPLKDCCARLVVRAEVLVVDEFLLQGRLEACHYGIVVAVADAAHALHGHHGRICCNRRMQRVACQGPRLLSGSTDPGTALDRRQILETHGCKLATWTLNTLLLAGAILPTGGVRDSSGRLPHLLIV